MTAEKKYYQRLITFMHYRIAGNLAVAVLTAGFLFLGCNMTTSVDKTGTATRAISPGANIPPGLGLKKIVISEIRVPEPADSPEIAATRAAECLFNHPAEHSTQVLNDCKQPHTSAQVFSAKVKSVRSDTAGNQHIRITQWYRGLLVKGSEIICHLNSAGEIYRVNGAYLPSLDIAVQPSISQQAALSLGMQNHQGAAGLIVSQEPKLVIFARRLAYHYIIIHQGPGSGQWHYYVDAATSEIIFRHNNIQTK